MIKLACKNRCAHKQHSLLHHYWRRCNFSWSIAYVVISPSIPFKTCKIRATRHINLTDLETHNFKLNIMNWALYFDWDTINLVPVSFPSVWLLWLPRMAQQQVEKAEPSCSLKNQWLFTFRRAAADLPPFAHLLLWLHWTILEVGPAPAQQIP